MSVFADLVEHLADLLQPLFHASATAAAIVLFTALVRLAVHPLSRAAARGQKARVRARAADRGAAQEAREESGAAAEGRCWSCTPRRRCRRCPAACRACSSCPRSSCSTTCSPTRGSAASPTTSSPTRSSPRPSATAGPTRSRDGGVFGAAGLVYVGLFVIVAAVAAFNFRRTKRQMAASPAMPAGTDQPVPGMGRDDRRSCRSCPSPRSSPWRWCRSPPRCTS